VDELHLIGGEGGPILEVIVSRMRYISSQAPHTYLNRVPISYILSGIGIILFQKLFKKKKIQNRHISSHICFLKEYSQVLI